MEHVIWRFQTCEGSVRLGLAAPKNSMRAMNDGLIVASAHATSYSAFLEEAVRIIDDGGGMLGDILRQSWTVPTLQERLKEAASLADTLEMARFILRAAKEASATEIASLLYDPSGEVYRNVIRDLIPSLDQAAPEFTQSLAINLSISVSNLLDSLHLREP